MCIQSSLLFLASTTAVSASAFSLTSPVALVRRVLWSSSDGGEGDGDGDGGAPSADDTRENAHNPREGWHPRNPSTTPPQDGEEISFEYEPMSELFRRHQHQHKRKNLQKDLSPSTASASSPPFAFPGELSEQPKPPGSTIGFLRHQHQEQEDRDHHDDKYTTSEDERSHRRPLRHQHHHHGTDTDRELGNIFGRGSFKECWHEHLQRTTCAVELSTAEQRTRLALNILVCQMNADGRSGGRSDTSSSSSSSSSSQEQQRDSSFFGGGGTSTSRITQCVRDTASTDTTCVKLLDNALYIVLNDIRLHLDHKCFIFEEELKHQRAEAATTKVKEMLDAVGLQQHKAYVQSQVVLRNIQDVAVQEEALVALLERRTTEMSGLHRAMGEISQGQQKLEGQIETSQTKLLRSQEKQSKVLGDIQSTSEHLGETVSDVDRRMSKSVTQLQEIFTLTEMLQHGSEVWQQRLTDVTVHLDHLFGVFAVFDAIQHYAWNGVLVYLATLPPQTRRARYPALYAGPMAFILLEQYMLRCIGPRVCAVANWFAAVYLGVVQRVLLGGLRWVVATMESREQEQRDRDSAEPINASSSDGDDAQSDYYCCRVPRAHDDALAVKAKAAERVQRHMLRFLSLCVVLLVVLRAWHRYEEPRLEMERLMASVVQREIRGELKATGVHDMIDFLRQLQQYCEDQKQPQEEEVNEPRLAIAPAVETPTDVDSPKESGQVKRKGGRGRSAKK